MSKSSGNLYLRFPVARRIEHFIMLSSFTTLGLTGLPQKYPDSSIGAFVLNILMLAVFSVWFTTVFLWRLHRYLTRVWLGHDW